MSAFSFFPLVIQLCCLTSENRFLSSVPSVALGATGGHWSVSGWFHPFWSYSSDHFWISRGSCVTAPVLHSGDGCSSAPDACVVDHWNWGKELGIKCPTCFNLHPRHCLACHQRPSAVQGNSHSLCCWTWSVRSFSITGVPVLCTQHLFLLGVEVERLWDVTRARCAQVCQFVRQPKGWELSQVFIQRKKGLLLSVGHHTAKQVWFSWWPE